MVIIGLVIGGVLIGRDLIESSTARSQVTQIEQYRTAVHVFKDKYDYLPGDILQTSALAAGLVRDTLGCAPFCGNGNGLIDCQEDFPTEYCNRQQGEATTFWQDLSSAGLIQGTFSTGLSNTSTEKTENLLPKAKIGDGFYLSAATGGIIVPFNDNNNYFFLAYNSGQCNGSSAGHCIFSDKIKVIIAANIDKKADDGLPNSGKTQAFYSSGLSPVWAGHDYAATGHGYADEVTNTPKTDANYNGNSTSCYYNRNPTAQPMQYATKTNANNRNCALSFQF